LVPILLVLEVWYNGYFVEMMVPESFTLLGLERIMVPFFDRFVDIICAIILAFSQFLECEQKG